MNKYNISVLAEAKQEYTRQLVNIMAPHLYVGVKSIYDTAASFCKRTNDKNVLKKFQLLLSTIPDWNQTKINEEYRRISQDSECDWIEDLITAVFVSHTKVLSSIKLKKKSKPIELDVPEGPYFTHKCYIEVARNFWKKPYLLHTDFSNLEIQRNLSDSELVIKDSIIECIRKLLPVKYILKEYLGNDFVDEEEDITSDVSVNTKSNLRKLVKQEIEQSLSKEAISDKNDDKIENFSRIEVQNSIEDTKSSEKEDTKSGEKEDNVSTEKENMEGGNLEKSDAKEPIEENVEQSNPELVLDEDAEVTKENLSEDVGKNTVEEKPILLIQDKEEPVKNPVDIEAQEKQEDSKKEENTKVIVLDKKSQEGGKIEKKTEEAEVIDLGSKYSEEIDNIIDKENNELDKNIVNNKTEDNVDNKEYDNSVQTMDDIRADIKETIKENNSKDNKDETTEFSFFEDAAPF